MKIGNMKKIYSWVNDVARPNCDGKFGGVGWYRIINPLEKIGALVERKGALLSKSDAFEMKAKGDVWWMSPMGNPEALALLHTNSKITGAKIVLDIDDHPFAVDPKHPQYQYHKEQETILRFQIEHCDHLVVSTEPLKSLLSPLNPNVSVCPNGIDLSIWNVKRKKRTDGKIRLGWIGSSSHIADIPVVEKVIPELLEEYPNLEFHHAGMALFDEINKNEIAHKGTKGYEEYPQFLADLDLDIAIAPLKDTPFNRCKTNIKWLEHSMLKVPMVLSDVYPYKSVERGKTGFLANSQAQWKRYLKLLIEDESKRKEIGENAYNEVVKNWNIENFLPLYEEVYEKVRPKNITVYTSLVGKYDTISKRRYNAEQIAFTDQKSDVWKVEEPCDKFIDPSRNSRIQKILPHLYISTEYSLYMDANIELLVDPQQLVDEWLKDKDIAVFKHCGRDCIYEEAEAILYYKKETEKAIGEQVKDYVLRGIPQNAGLAECGVILRRHTPEIERMNEKWWAQYCRYSRRDQMSFPIAFDLKKVNLIEGSAHTHPYFKVKNHLCTS
jgi:glycosyltransferase involved in cell wall biosynthesis